jgi:t-SNARE complex subunit (syntaxin)
MDRLAELKAGSTARASSSGATTTTTENPVQQQADLEAGEGGSQFMKKFFDDVETVKADVKEIKAACKKIQSINQEVLLATSSEVEARCSTQLNKVLGSANRAAKRCKATLQSIQDETDEMKAKQNKSKASELRIRENLMNTLSRKFVEIVKEYQQRQQDYKDDVKKKVARQVRIVKEDATDAEIDDVMHSGGTEKVLQAAILKTAADPVREAYEKAQDKYKDVLRLEKSVLELHQMFVDFALLTNQQGELLDQIEFNVSAAEEFVSGGNEDLAVAIEIQSSIMKKQCCVIITVLVLGVILMFATGFLP